MTYVRDTYGHDKVANVSNYVTFRARSLLRDIGKAMGFDTSEIDRLRELLGYSRGDGLAEEIERKPELREIGIDVSQYADLFALCAQLSGLPRHLGTHSSAASWSSDAFRLPKSSLYIGPPKESLSWPPTRTMPRTSGC